MAYQDTKVYYDGSHYIAIPKRPAPRHPGAKFPEDLVEVVDEGQDEPMEELEEDPKEVEEQPSAPQEGRRKSRHAEGTRRPKA